MDRRAVGVELGLACLVGGLCALLVAGPALPKLWTALPGVAQDDGLHAVYLHHQVHAAVAAGRFDLSDPATFWPTGAPLARMNGGNILEMLLSGIFRFILPFPAWLSLSALAWIPLNLLASQPLGWALWGRRLPALAAGAAWALSPALLAQISSLRLTQVALVGLPLAVLGLLRLSETGGRKAAALTGAGLALLGLGYWFYAAMLLACLPLFLLHARRRRPPLALLKELALAGGLALLLVSPALGPQVLALAAGAWMPAAPLTAEHSSPLFQDALQLSLSQPPGLRGWLPLVLLLAAPLSLRLGQRRGLWLGCALLCTTFALGPAQDLLGYRWLLPYYPLWRWFPGVDRMSHPDRWLGIGGLFWVIFAADGLARIRPRLTVLLPAGVLAQQLVVGQLPLSTWAFPVPAVWQAVADLPPPSGPEAIVVLPLMRAPNSVAWAHLHGRPLLGAMVENQPWFIPPAQRAFLDASPLVHDLWALSQGGRTPPALWQADLDRLAEAGFAWILLDRRSWRRNPPSAAYDPEPMLSAAWGRPVWTGPDGALWRLPATGQPGPAPERGPLVFDGPRPTLSGASAHPLHPDERRAPKAEPAAPDEVSRRTPAYSAVKQAAASATAAR